VKLKKPHGPCARRHKKQLCPHPPRGYLAARDIPDTKFEENPMKLISLATIVLAGLAGCSVNSGHASRPTSWGKEGVSMLDYQTDGILCATLAERAEAGNNSNTAGGLNGSNNSAGGGGNGSAGSQGGDSMGSWGGGTYRETASPDLVNRAANQHQSREMQLKQARMDALRSCLVGRGYTEFELTEVERAKVDSLPAGSDERRNYLYTLGTNPEILKTRGVTRPASAAPATNKATPEKQKQ
jgi:hypothetical protein